MAESTSENHSHLYKVPESFQVMPDEDIVELKVIAQTLPPAGKPTEETLQVPPKPSALQLPDVSQPDLQSALPDALPRYYQKWQDC